MAYGNEQIISHFSILHCSTHNTLIMSNVEMVCSLKEEKEYPLAYIYECDRKKSVNCLQTFNWGKYAQ